MQKNISEYEKDFSAWAIHNAELLRAGRFSEVDITHLIEELEGMGASNRHELVSRLKILLMHLLKWQFQFQHLSTRWQEFEGVSWRRTIIEQRDQIQDLLSENPSLKAKLEEAVCKAYPGAVKLASKESRLPMAIFPQACPYDYAQILDDDFYPDNLG
ncbi:DUF29 domain-containing protein [Candidatus Venteria ishoeyi]|uniref:DUF29 domain-containing protein n=1 Tax=Candidatus Venteria ishoeyi TaxID=1899563 RepID=UPI0025A5D720|nr:DUF29 domain-containing protein [Candidatus Venteria ishoeyi]MDM8546901.1 DUF29 domain-containing protein [Candidatus Venteria ishoeyi]